jgi:nitrogen-specific signal transduction histidine kinase/ActR/RegA family two-component response regulator
MAQDISEQVKLENHLRQAQRMEALGQLAAGVAHDLNNILTVVQGNASLLLTDQPAGSAERKPLESICAAANRAAKLIGQLLTFGRRHSFELRPTDLGSTLKEFCELLPRFIGERIAVRTLIPAVLPRILADPGMVEQVLMDLAVNARDAMPDGGSLVLSAEAIQIDAAAARESQDARPGRFICLSLKDTGCGIAPEVLPRIFEPFFAAKTAGGGSGMGLAAVYGIAKQHQGWVQVESRRGQGSIFRVFLPVGEGLEEAGPGDLPPQPLRGGKECILVVEDEAQVRDFIAEVLRSHGYTVLSAVSGPQALEVWTQCGHRIDLLLTDMVMPGEISGRDLALRLLARNPTLRVIYTSGYSPGMANKDLTLVEGENYLAKPYAIRKLLKAVRDRLDQRQPVG